MPSSGYQLRYNAAIPNDPPGAWCADWRLTDADGFVVPSVQTHRPLPFAAFSNYELDFEWKISANFETRTVEFYLGVDEFQPFYKIGEAVIGAVTDQGLGDGHVVVPIHLAFSTPAAANNFNIFARKGGAGLLNIVALNTPRPVATVTYIGGSAACSDVIPPPPPLGGWCEPFLPTDAQSIEDLIDAHYDRVGALADGTYT